MILQKLTHFRRFVFILSIYGMFPNVAMVAQTADGSMSNCANGRPVEQGSSLLLADAATSALHRIRSARVALLNGNQEQGLTALLDASTDLNEAAQDLDRLRVLTQKKAPGDDEYVAIEVTLKVSQGHIEGEETKQTLDQANLYLINGDPIRAMYTLRLAKIDIAAQTNLVPVRGSLEYIESAHRLALDGQLYEASQLLKAVEDSVITETYALNDFPDQGCKRNE